MGVKARITEVLFYILLFYTSRYDRATTVRDSDTFHNVITFWELNCMACVNALLTIDGYI